MRKFAFSVSAAIISLSACTNTGNPQLAMCQAVANQLTSNGISSWDSDSSTDNPRHVTVKVGFTNSYGQASTINCKYPKQENGNIDTAPSDVVLNNQPVDRKVLYSAGTKASKELLTGTYNNTVAKTTELANEAGVKANELAGQAAAKASELADQAKDAAVKGATALQDLQKP